MKNRTAEDGDSFVPDRVVRQEIGDITVMTLWRWDRDPEMIALGWPPKIQIGARNYRSRRQLEHFKANLMRRAINARSRSQQPEATAS
jgi:hypothetical protein